MRPKASSALASTPTSPSGWASAAVARHHGDVPELPPDRRAPHPRRLPPSRPDREAIVAAHEAALAAGQPGYLDPATGLFVMSAQQLWDRGTCCDSGCRHCPYLPR